MDWVLFGLYLVLVGSLDMTFTTNSPKKCMNYFMLFGCDLFITMVYVLRPDLFLLPK
jgi:hypothetical protein